MVICQARDAKRGFYGAFLLWVGKKMDSGFVRASDRGMTAVDRRPYVLFFE